MSSKLAASRERPRRCWMLLILPIWSLVGSCAIMAPARQATPRAHPILPELAVERLHETVGVIVQKWAKQWNAECADCPWTHQ